MSRLKSWIKKTPQQQQQQQHHQDNQSSSTISSHLGGRLLTMSSSINGSDPVSSRYLLTTTTPSIINHHHSAQSASAATPLSPNVANTSSSHPLGYNPPLSIDFVRKIKRPSQVPSALDYANNQVFQGSALEEWLMHTLDEHIHSAAYINQTFIQKQVINTT